jgi:REase_MTES_1575
MVLAIEADGASYRQSGSVRDRDRLRGEHLQRLGWRYHRLWSTNWFHNPDAEVAKVQAAYLRAISAAGPAAGQGREATAAAGDAGHGPADGGDVGDRAGRGEAGAGEHAPGEATPGQVLAGELAAAQPPPARSGPVRLPAAAPSRQREPVRLTLPGRRE